MNRRLSFLHGIGCILLVCLYSTQASATDPRAYVNLPLGTSLTQLGYGTVSSDTSIDVNVAPALTDVELTVDMDLWFYRYAYFFEVAGQTAGVSIFGAYSKVDAELGPFSNDDSWGWTDPTILFGMPLFGSPALSPEEFGSYHLDQSLVLVLYLTIPSGDYDRDSIINLGENRWAFKPELAYNLAIGEHGVGGQFNLYANATMYTLNDEAGGSALATGDQLLSQDPKFGLEGYYSYDFNRAIWGSAGLIWTFGGQQYIDGEKQGEEEDLTNLALSLNGMVSPQNMLTLSYNHKLTSDNTDQTTWLLRWMYLFGGFGDFVDVVKKSRALKAGERG